MLKNHLIYDISSCCNISNQKCLARGESVLVHCLAGAHRFYSKIFFFSSSDIQICCCCDTVFILNASVISVYMRADTTMLLMHLLSYDNRHHQGWNNGDDAVDALARKGQWQCFAGGQVELNIDTIRKKINVEH